MIDEGFCSAEVLGHLGFCHADLLVVYTLAQPTQVIHQAYPLVIEDARAHEVQAEQHEHAIVGFGPVPLMFQQCFAGVKRGKVGAVGCILVDS